MASRSQSPTAEWYARAADRDLVGHSALHVEWARGVSTDPEILGLLDRLPREHRQPSLIFSVASYLGAPPSGWPQLRDWLLANWARVEEITRMRRTQTNEPGRAAPLAAALDRIAGPIALIEIGASAGLCLIPDRYTIAFDRDGERSRVGSGQLTLHCRVTGDGRLPRTLPEIVWRRGIDLAPLSVLDPDDVRWLESLVPPDRPDRLARLRAAIETAQSDPPTLIAGDALGALAEVAATAPPGVTLVVASLGTAVYLPPLDRERFLETTAALGARTVTLEGVSAIPQIAASLAGRSAPDPTPFVLAVDGKPIAHSTAHGDGISWLADDLPDPAPTPA